MMDKDIIVSIVVPIYNVERYLSKCLDSLINQSLKNIEILLINDGSTDNSLTIMNKYASIDNRIRIINQNNFGQGMARNVGIESSNGKYILFIDSDDYIEIDMAEKMYKQISKNNCDICICSNKVVDENNKLLYIDNIIDGEFGNYKTNPYIMFVNMGPCNKMYKRKFLIKNHLRFPGNKKIWYEDLPFVAKSLLCANSICWTNVPYYNYLQRSQSVMNNSNLIKNLDIIESFEILKHDDFISREFNKELEFICICHLYLFSSVRILRLKQKMSKKREALHKLYGYINDNFPEYKKNEYIKYLSVKRKLLLKLLDMKLYYIIYIMFMFK